VDAIRYGTGFFEASWDEQERRKVASGVTAEEPRVTGIRTHAAIQYESERSKHESK